MPPPGFSKAPGAPEAAPLIRSAPQAPRRALSIEGTILGTDLVGLPGLSVVCGEEIAATGPDGRFSFPPSVRPRWSALRVLRGADVLAAYEVLTGDRAVAAAPETQEGPSDEPPWLPETLERIRWTLNVLDPPILRTFNADWARPRVVFCEDWGTRVRIRFSGETQLPDGAAISVSLNFDGCRMLCTTVSPVSKAGAFSGEIVSPEGFRLHSGRYELEVAYTFLAQDLSMVEEWAKQRPDLDWPAVRPPEVLVPVFLGDGAEARAEDCAVAEYYGRMLEEVRGLERALISRVEEILDAVYAIDPAELRRLAEESRWAEIAQARRDWDPALLEARYRARSLWRHRELVEGGIFQEARWRQFLDREWRPAVVALKEKHGSRSQEKYPDAAARLSALLENLLSESYALSNLLVYPPWLPQHPNDFYLDEGWAEDLERMQGLVRANFAGLEKYRDLCR